MKIIGTVEFKDFDTLLKWHKELTPETGRQFVSAVQDKIKEIFPECKNGIRRNADAAAISDTARAMYYVEVRTFIGLSDAEKKRWEDDDWKRMSESTAKKLSQFHQFATEIGQALNVGCWNEVFAYLYFGNPAYAVIVPTPQVFFNYTPAVDLSDVSLPEVRALLGVAGSDTKASSWLPAELDERSITPRVLAEMKSQQEAAMAELDQEEQQIKDCEKGELAGIKAQIAQLQATMEAKQQALMIELEDKKGEMEEKMNQLNAQIFMLDSQIYAIQCFAGEIVKFSHVRKGANAPMTEPVVIYQKLRFLDEDLGRMVSMYQLDWSKIGLFEDFLRHSPEAVETFAPSRRCITLIRLSKTNKVIGQSSKHPYSNLLENYEYFHGRTVGIIIRNGENVYLGWTDEDRISIEDDFIISRTVTNVSPGERAVQYSDKLSEKRAERLERESQFRERMRMLNFVVSRAFVLNVLQGVVKNTSWLPLPPGESLSKQSPYVRYSLADMCLEDHRFSDFDQLIALANKDVAEGDDLLTMQFLRAHSGQYYHNDRGRGYADRTHDVSVRDCSIYKANLVEYDKPVKMLRYKFKTGFPGKEEWRTCETKEDGSALSDDCIIIDRFERINQHIFVSLEKKNWSCSTVAPRANFELYDDEYINLTFMNSVWLTWAINTKNLGNWHVKGTEIIYAHAIRYLNTALEFVRRREEQEKEAIDAVDPIVCKDPEWPLLLSDWKFMLSLAPEKRSVRKITPFQAKRFVKWISDGMPGRKNYQMPL